MQTYTLPPLPYSPDALEPYISKETLDFHYGKHHKAYVDKLNQLVAGTEWEGKPIELIIRETFKKDVKIFNQAAQAWNHTFYWHSLKPAQAGKQNAPTGKLERAIQTAFGSLDEFKKKFNEAAAGHFGSGWAWLVSDSAGTLRITTTHDADNPLTKDEHPLFTVDVWEHAYYIDQRNARAKYLDNIWSVLNWEFAAEAYNRVSQAA